MLPKLFTLVLEYAFKRIDWGSKGLTIEEETLHHLRFTDNIIIIAKTKEELRNMLIDAHTASARVGLKINFNKTKYMTNAQEQDEEAEEMTIGNDQMERVSNYVYLGELVMIMKSWK